MENAVKKSNATTKVDIKDMSTDGLLTVEVSDFKAYFGSLRVDFVDEFISKCLEHAGTNERWSLSVCCKCQEKIGDSNSHEKHVLSTHLDNHPNEKAGMPQIINRSSAEMILNHCWEPLDVLAALKMLENESKCQVVGHPRECECLLKDHFGRVDDGSNSPMPRVYTLPSSWLTGNSQLKELLKKIHHRFEELIRHDYIAESHLNRLSQFTLDELQHISIASLSQNYGLDLVPTCICFLGAPQLRKVLQFLEEIYQYCGLGNVSETSGTRLEEVSNISKGMASETVIVLSSDASYLLLRGQWPPSKSNFTCQDASHNVFSSTWNRETLRSWKRSIEDEEKTPQSEEVVQMLQKEHNGLHRFCDRRLHLLKYEEALITLESSLELVNEIKISVLRKRLSELKKNFYDTMVLNGTCDLDATSAVLQEAEHMNAYLGSYVDGCGGLTWPPGLASSTESICIEHAIFIEKHKVSLEIAEVDARILRIVSARDYQSLLLPLVNSFLRARHEGLSKSNST